MGKQKHQRNRAHKQNPTGLPSVKDFEEETEEFTNEERESTLQKVFDDITSTEGEDKMSSLQVLESMSYDSAMAQHIAKSGVTKRVGPILVDHSIALRGAAANTLRVIAESGGEEALTCMIADDIMTPLSAALKRYKDESSVIGCEENRSKIDINDDRETFVQAVTLLWTLSENDESIVKFANDEEIVSMLIKYLNVEMLDIEVSTLAAQCLLTLTEDNPHGIKRLYEQQSRLFSLLQLRPNEKINLLETIPLKVLAAGLLMNTVGYTETSTAEIIHRIAIVLAETLNIDHVARLNEIIGVLPDNEDAMIPAVKKQIEGIKKIFGAQQQALEILANVVSEDPQCEVISEDEDSETTGDESENVDEIMEADDKPFQVASSLPIEIVEAITSRQLVKKAWEKSVALDANIVKNLSKHNEGKTLLKIMHTIRCRAYLCLNNLISSFEVEAFGGINDMYKLWSDVGVVVFKEADPKDIDLLESATSVMRAALHKIAEARANPFEKLTLADIQPMLSGERQCPNSNVRANLINILGNLSLILINNNDTANSWEIVQHISTFLLNICIKETEVWIMAEALDAIMDIYSEDETNKWAFEIHLLEKLQTLLPIFKTKVRQQKKLLGDNASVVITVNSNILRFIKYKEKQLRNFSSAS